MINHGPRFLWVAIVLPNGRMYRLNDGKDNEHGFWKLGCRNTLESIQQQLPGNSYGVLKADHDTPALYRVYYGDDMQYPGMEEPRYLRFRDEDAAIMCAIMKARQ